LKIDRVLKEGDQVEKDSEIAEIDSDKATLSITAETGGIIHLLANQGDTIAVGTVICTIDPDSKEAGTSPKPLNESSSKAPVARLVPDGRKERGKIPALT
jgi:2-oxoglutarate dehydrogenase E2 component (dihydrolipoamide succinyltransferase)